MRHVILIDNYDSFTYNLAQYLYKLADKVSVFRNDAINIDQLKSLQPTHFVLSPGPGRPDRKRDIGVCEDILEKTKSKLLQIPILGVCLGHQGIAHVFGGQVVKGKIPMHGKTSDIWHLEDKLFANIPNPMTVMRYHSLIVEPLSLPECLSVTAKTDDNVIMGLKHKHLPIHGVQFHPESIGTPEGIQLLTNFLDQTEILG